MPDDTRITHAAPPALTATTPRRRGRVLWTVASLALVLAVLAAAFVLTRPSGRTAPAATPTAPPVLTVQTMPVREQTLQRPVIGDGSVVAWQELVVGIEAGGLRVAEVPIEEGERVTKGQVLARLDDLVLAAQAGSARGSVTEAEAALALAQAELRRATELSRTDAVARQTLEQRQANLRQTEARLLSARARLEEAEARLAQTRILAPADGIVARRSILPGAVAQPGQEVARLIRDGRLELAARVPELELPGIAPGQHVRVRHGANEIEGEVRAVAPVVAAETRLGTVHVALPAGSGLRPGMFAQAEILPAARPALVVPNEAVIFRDGRSTAFVLPEGSDRVALRAVRTGERRGGVIEILEGLQAGDRVVATGAGFLSDGDRVRVAPAS